MKIGICTPVANAAAVAAAGWDYVEESVQGLLRAHDQKPDQWRGGDAALGSVLPIPVANMMVPGTHKIVGPEADTLRLSTYMTVMLSRAQRVGLKVVVFGSGGARQVPDGWPRERAYEQIVAFLKSAAPLAEDRGVTIVVEHLNKGECNILNGVAECADVVRRVDHPNVKLLLDTFHLWTDGIDLEEVRANVGLIRHVHLADKDGRVAPGESGTADYGPVFRILKEAGYDARMSVEAGGFEVEKVGAKVAKYVREAWEKA